MQARIATGIDVGTHRIKAVIAERSRDGGAPRIIGTGSSESKGLRHGYVVNVDEAARSIRAAVAEAERMADVSVSEAVLSVGGIGLSSITATGSLSVARSDNEITEDDMELVQHIAEESIPPAEIQNRRIIYSIPIEYRVDKKHALGSPAGMQGTELGVTMLFITCLEHHIRDLVEAAAEAGIEATDVAAAPIAASLVTLSRAQKVAGCVLVNIGSETLSITVFENDMPVSLEILPVGSTDITHDIALGMKVSLEEAETVKKGGFAPRDYPQKKLDDIMASRLSNIFSAVDTHLKRLGRSGLLPAGIIITGGGASIANIKELAESSLRLPSRVAHIQVSDSAKNKDSVFAVAYGLCIIGLHSGRKGPLKLGGSGRGFSRTVGRFFKKAGEMFSKFLP